MAKYVLFSIPDKEPVYIEVEDFDLETIKKIWLYSNKWFSIVCLDGKPRFFAGNILDTYSSKVIKSIYYGKRISYEETKKIVGNDLKYKDLLWDMNNNSNNAFDASSINVKSSINYDTYSIELEIFRKEYDKSHYCLFTLPDYFGTSILLDENTITVEEFDPSIKLDYSKQLENIQMNAQAGEEYIESHKYVIEMFKAYFEALISLTGYFKDENYDKLFEVIKFDFRWLKDMDTLDDINFFLAVFAYTENKSYYDELLNAYRSYINKKYEDNIELS